jgi:DNA-binding winged helix-turn-helix (wHTH) protein/TolB-like protein/Flp pilus assembly protein TadD
MRGLYEFGPFTFDEDARELRREGRRVPLTPKDAELLLLLLRDADRVVEKPRIMAAVWPRTHVTDGSLTQSVHRLRQALGDTGSDPLYIEAVPKRGYRFVADVRTANGGEEVEPLVETRRETRVVSEDEEKTGGRSDHADRTRDVTGGTGPEVGAPRRSRVAAVVGVLVLLAGLAAVALYLRADKGSAPGGSVPRFRSIAVLPFKSLSAGGDDGYLGLGMADAIITKLSNARHLAVRPTSAVRRYADGEQSALKAGQELRAEAVLEGSVQRLDDRLRVTVRLIGVEADRPLWGEKFDEKFTDIFAVQDLISERVAAALELELTGEERRQLAKRYTDNTEAYGLYLKGRYSSGKWTQEGFQKGIEYFKQAIALDPTYALAYAGLADSYYGQSNIGVPPREALPQMKEMASKAVALDESLAEAHSALSVALNFYDWDWHGAEREVRRAIELNPNNAQFHLTYGDFLSTSGRFDEATPEYKRAQELDPTSPVINASLAFHFLRARNYDRAAEESRKAKALELDPENQWPLSALGYAYLYKGEPAEALAVFQKLVKQEDGAGFFLEGEARSYAALGKRAEALKILDEMKERSERQYISSYFVATIHLQLGDKDKALDYLERAYEERSPSLGSLKTDSQFDVLRSDPRFIELLRRLRFEP